MMQTREKNPLTRRAALIAVVFLVAATPAGRAAEPDKLRAVSALPPSMAYTRGFAAYVADVNKRGKGVLEIEMLSGDDAIPAAAQTVALRDGKVDMVFAPVNLHAGLVPEAAAITASEVKAMELRTNGGMALIDQIHRVRMNARFLGLLNTGARLHIYLRGQPPMIDGMPDLTGLRVAGQANYGDFLKSLRATPVAAEFPSARAAVEGGDSDGMIWPRMGLGDLFAAKKLKYRIDPGFAQIATGVAVHLPSWNRLSAKSRDILIAAMIEHELISYTAARVETGKADETVELQGLQVISVKGKTRDGYAARATSAAWDRLRKRSPTYAAQLERVFYREPAGRK